MRAAVLRELGKPPKVEEFPEPPPADGEVLIHVVAAALKSVDKQIAAGTHYGSPRELPVICGTDGVGRLENGTRVFFGGPRRPYGTMAERAVAKHLLCFPIPEDLDDVTAAAIPNPGVSAWLSLKHIAKLGDGETVLILGATGVTGKLAVQIARLLGAARIVAAGRNEKVLETLHELGADATIHLDQPDQQVIEAFRFELGKKRFDVIIDYLWGRPTEALLNAMTAAEFAAAGSQTRLVEVGESAGPTIALSAAVLRSTALAILGTAGIPPWDVLTDAFNQVMNLAVLGKLRIDTERVSLAKVAEVWDRNPGGRRLVLMP